ncbi:MAG TPA: DUF2071 domain-containing protein [Oscillatoriaceae cyanobacterium]
MPFEPSGLPTGEHVVTPMLPFEVDLTLEGYTLIVFSLPPERLQALLPPGLEPATTTLDGVERAWLSIFLGRNVLRRIGGWPALPFRLNQVNYRAYVRLREGHGLVILRSVVGFERLPRALALPLELSARAFFKYPVEFAEFHFEPTFSEKHLVRVAAEVPGELSVSVESTGLEPETPGFALPKEAIAWLADVPEAYFPLGHADYRQLLSPHPPLAPTGGVLLRGKFDWLAEKLGDARLLAHPTSIYMQAGPPFPVYV